MSDLNYSNYLKKKKSKFLTVIAPPILDFIMKLIRKKKMNIS